MRTQWCLPTSCLPCFSHSVNPVPPPGISTVSTAFFSLNFLSLRDQPWLAFLHPSSKFWRMGNQLAHFGSSNFPSPVVYGKEQSLAEPTWVQKHHPSVCFWICEEEYPRESKPQKKLQGILWDLFTCDPTNRRELYPNYFFTAESDRQDYWLTIILHPCLNSPRDDY